MMMTSPIARAALVAALALGCGGGSVSTTVDGSTTTSDSGVNTCEMEISFSPESPHAPGTIYVDGSINHGSFVGVEDYSFYVSFDDHSVAVEERDPFDGSKIAFAAEEIGPYRVTLYGSVGYQDCIDRSVTINVTDATAPTENYRLRFVPTLSQPAPIQERVVEIPGGADYSLGGVSLDNGVSASGAIVDSDATPLAAYLRVISSGTDPQVVETFADSAGEFSTRLAAGTYDVLVIPADEGVAPELRTGLAVGGLSLLTLTAGDAISGTVRDGAGSAVVGARVSLRIDGVPSTIATTGAGGEFTVLARAGGATAVTVAPPPGSGLPRLELPASAGLVASVGVELAIAYAAGSTARDLSIPVNLSDGLTPAPATRVTWIARPLSAVGSVTADGDSYDAAGALRLTSVADAGGVVTATQLPEALYDVILEPVAAPAGELVALTTVDLRPSIAPPTALALASAVLLTGSVNADSSPVANVVITALPRDLLANVGVASAMAVTDSAGEYSLGVIGGGEYDLVFAAPGDDLTRARLVAVTAPLADPLVLDPVELDRAIAVSGQLTIPGVAGGAAGVHVMALCYACTGVEAVAPVAEAVTDSGGRFTLAIPDPGLGE